MSLLKQQIIEFIIFMFILVYGFDFCGKEIHAPPKPKSSDCAKILWSYCELLQNYSLHTKQSNGAPNSSFTFVHKSCSSRRSFVVSILLSNVIYILKWYRILRFLLFGTLHFSQLLRAYNQIDWIAYIFVWHAFHFKQWNTLARPRDIVHQFV